MFNVDFVEFHCGCSKQFEWNECYLNGTWKVYNYILLCAGCTCCTPNFWNDVNYLQWLFFTCYWSFCSISPHLYYIQMQVDFLDSSCKFTSTYSVTRWKKFTLNLFMYFVLTIWKIEFAKAKWAKVKWKMFVEMHECHWQCHILQLHCTKWMITTTRLQKHCNFYPIILLSRRIYVAFEVVAWWHCSSQSIQTSNINLFYLQCK